MRSGIAHKWSQRAATVVLGATLGCSGLKQTADTCQRDEDCGPDSVCSAGRCATPCNLSSDCPGGGRCVHGVCDEAPADADCVGAACENSALEWWDEAFPFRLPIVVSAGAFERREHPVEIEVNLPARLRLLGGGTLDATSPRLVEHDADGYVVSERPSYFHIDAASGDGAVYFVLSGTTPAGAERHFALYFAAGATQKGAPVYWENRVERFAKVLGLELGSIASSGIPLAALSFRDLRTEVGDTVYNRRLKCLSSAGNFGSGGRSETAFTAGQPPTRRLNTRTARLVENSVSAGGLVLREITWVVASGVLHHTLYISNPTVVPVSALKIFQGMDTDIYGYPNSAAHVAADDITYGWNPGQTQKHYIGMRGDVPSLGHTATGLSAMFTELDVGLLAGTDAGEGDIGIAQGWSVGDVLPGQKAVLRYHTAIADDYPRLRALLLAAATPPQVTLGNVESVQPAPPPTRALAIDNLEGPYTVQFHEPVPLIWSARGAASCALSGPGFSESVPSRGSRVVRVEADMGAVATVRLDCADAGGALTSYSLTLAIDSNYGVLSAADASALTGATRVPGVLRINESNLANLAGLESLTQVEWLEVADNPALTSIDGLGVRQVDGGLTIQRNPMLANVAALSGITTVPYDVRVADNPLLTSIGGLLALTSVSRLQLINLPRVTSLAPLSELRGSVTEVTINAIPGLANLDGLDRITRVTETLDIQNNTGLTSLRGLQGLVGPVEYIYIQYNGTLTNLAELSGLSGSPYDVYINGEATLLTLAGLSGLSGVVDTLSIYDNASLTSLQGLGGVTGVDYLEVSYNDALGSLSGLGGVTAVDTTLLIMSNPALPNLSALTSLTRVGQELIIEDNERLPTCQAEALRTRLVATAPIATVSIIRNDDMGTCP